MPTTGPATMLALYTSGLTCINGLEPVRESAMPEPATGEHEGGLAPVPGPGASIRDKRETSLLIWPDTWWPVRRLAGGRPGHGHVRRELADVPPAREEARRPLPPRLRPRRGDRPNHYPATHGDRRILRRAVRRLRTRPADCGNRPAQPVPGVVGRSRRSCRDPRGVLRDYQPDDDLAVG